MKKLKEKGKQLTMNPEENKTQERENKSFIRKRINTRKIISNLLIIIGLMLIIVPLVMTYINAKRDNDIIDEFLQEVEMAAAESEAIQDDELAIYQVGTSPTPSATLVSTPSQTALPETQTPQPEAETSTPEPPQPTKKPSMSKEEIKKRMTGVLLIEKINVKMVIMDGVDEETLRVAAGRMPNTGHFDEIGNCVLAGHRSHTTGKKFSRLDELVPGDEIIVQTKEKNLKYIIYKKHVVEPTDFSITNKNGTDKILTLFTCHPPLISTHRLVVHAKQVE